MRDWRLAADLIHQRLGPSEFHHRDEDTALDAAADSLANACRSKAFAVPISPPHGEAGDDLNEILANLLDNAFKHAGSRVEISAGIAKSGSNVVIRIDDDGPGLPAEAREIVFNVGERWDSQESGSGLGLAIARDLARLYGGDVTLAESPLGGLRVELVMASVKPA